jgi:hypothetical protein
VESRALTVVTALLTAGADPSALCPAPGAPGRGGVAATGGGGSLPFPYHLTPLNGPLLYFDRLDDLPTHPFRPTKTPL